MLAAALAGGLAGQGLASGSVDPEALAIEAALSDAGVSAADSRWLLLAADGRQWRRWDQDASILPGSLLKPFAALAWLEAERHSPPTLICRGDACWLPSGHGEIGLSQALAHSCNRYFAALTATLARDRVASVALRHGLDAPPAGPPEALWGWGDAWPVRAEALLAAYTQLAKRRDGAEALVLEGLRAAATKGTARGVGAALAGPALAKTGTAPCRHARRAPGDGLAIVIYPAISPRYTMLLQTCGRTGRESAAAVGLALARLTEPRGSAHR